MKRLRISSMLAMFALAMSQSACTQVDAGSSFGDRPLGRGEGRLVVDLVDAPNRAVKEIWVTIDKVTAHSDTQGWVTVMEGTLSVDLLTLQAFAQPLGFARLPPGKVTQVRLYTAAAGPQYVVLPDGTQVALKTPSGTQSGIKVQGPWDISACHNTEVTLDFDGHKSIWVHPTGQEELWVLRPVIKAKKSQMTPAPCEDAEGGTAERDGGAPGEADSGIDEGGDDGNRGAGEACSSGGECLSGACQGGVCEAGGPGTPCERSSDCASELCQEGGVCDPGSAGGSESACDEDRQCLSNACVESACGPGGQGTSCLGAADCATGFSCIAGECTPDIG